MFGINHKPRILCASEPCHIASELKLMGLADLDAHSLASKSSFYTMKLQNVPEAAAESLRVVFLPSGDFVSNGTGDVLLMGNLEIYARAIKAVKATAIDLADEIDAALSNYRSGASFPIVSATKSGSIFEEMQNRTLVMGILNVTPDSFSDGGSHLNRDAAIAHAISMVADGADIIDIGGESTRPGSEPVSPEEEIARVVPVIKELATHAGVPISIDTYHAVTARAALDAGADIINDISGMAFDPEMKKLAADRGCPVILMHIKGSPKDMQVDPTYTDLIGEVLDYLRMCIFDVVEAGVDEKMIVIDPGFGFGKRVEHNLELIQRLREFTVLGRPILMGTSRKSTIGQVLGGLPPEDRLEGTAATVALSIANGANIVRVHDVKDMARVAKMTDAIVRS